MAEEDDFSRTVMVVPRSGKMVPRVVRIPRDPKSRMVSEAASAVRKQSEMPISNQELLDIASQLSRVLELAARHNLPTLAVAIGRALSEAKKLEIDKETGRSLNPDRPYTVESLADRWSCSSAHVRHLIAKGTIASFSIGGKLVRISVEEVERVEASLLTSRS